MQAILQVVVPFFALIGLGYAAARFQVIGREHAEGITRFVYWFPLPVMLFRGIANRSPAEMADLRLLAVYAICTLTLFSVGLVVFRRLLRLPGAESNFHAFGSVQGNNGFLALPLMPALFGDAAIAPVALTLLADMLVLYPLVFVLADARSGQRHGWTELLGSVVRTFATNPFLIAMLLGLLVVWSGVTMPAVLWSFVDTLAPAGAPAALFVLGASLAIHRTRLDHRDEIVLISFIKLVGLPAMVALVGGLFIPLHPLHLTVGIATAALPTGLNLYMFSQRYVANPGVYSAAIMTTTALSLVSFSAVVWALGR